MSALSGHIGHGGSGGHRGLARHANAGPGRHANRGHAAGPSEAHGVHGRRGASGKRDTTRGRRYRGQSYWEPVIPLGLNVVRSAPLCSPVVRCALLLSLGIRTHLSADRRRLHGVLGTPRGTRANGRHGRNGGPTPGASRLAAGAAGPPRRRMQCRARWSRRPGHPGHADHRTTGGDGRSGATRAAARGSHPPSMPPSHRHQSAGAWAWHGPLTRPSENTYTNE